MEILPLSLIKSEQQQQQQQQQDKRIERRKPNWTECENVFLLDQFSLHREILTCKATDASTNLRKQEVWRIICQNLNKQNSQVRRTPAEVRRKWKNLVTAAKKEVWEMRHHAQVLGANRKLSELSQRVLQLHSTTATAIAAYFMNPDRDDNFRPNYAPSSSASPSPGSPGPGIGIGMMEYEHTTKNHHGYGISPHFGPLVQFRESMSSPTGSMSSEESRSNEFDSGIYEEAHDLRVNVNSKAAVAAAMGFNMNMNAMKVERQALTHALAHGHALGHAHGGSTQNHNENGNRNSEDTRELIKSTSTPSPDPNEDLIRDKLELQIEVFKLRKRKLEIEVRRLGRLGFWRMKSAKFLK